MCHVWQYVYSLDLPPKRKRRFVEIPTPKHGNKILGVNGILGGGVDPMYVDLALLSS